MCYRIDHNIPFDNPCIIYITKANQSTADLQNIICIMFHYVYHTFDLQHYNNNKLCRKSGGTNFDILQLSHYVLISVYY